MRIEVDPDACTGHGRCYSLAPELFDADDDGYCATRSLEVPAGQEAQARLAVDSCPEGAIRVVGERPARAG
jgi:ferredoxin